MSAFDPKRTLPEKWHGIKWPVGSGIQSSLGLAILEDIAANPGSRIIDVRRRLQRPRATADRALQALHVLGLLVCNGEEEQREDGPRYIRDYSLREHIALVALSVPDLSVDNLF
jgi:hypothetical protein